MSLLGKRYAIPTLLVLVGQTTTTTAPAPQFDYSALTSIVVAVIPLFVLIAVIKLLFRSFKDVA